MKKILFIVATMALVACSPRSQQAPMGYPEAEWAKAGEILMHTPWEELFDGVAHPAAGLFEGYFDVDEAAREHRNYAHMLQKNGIHVYFLTDVLYATGIDTLRKLAADGLTYDISDLSDEDPETAETYKRQIISQMSRSDLMRCILLRPTVRLHKTDNNTGLEAEYIHKPMMNLYFIRDQSITTPRGHIICHMNSSQRDAETDVIEACYHHLGNPPILRITGEGRLEGGDYLPAGTIAFIGCGMRTNDEGIRQIMEADAFGHDTIVVVRDHKRWQMQMHLDTHFNIIDRDLCTMVRSRLEAKPGEPEYNTCDIYARASGEKEYRQWNSNLSFVEFIRGRGMQIIPIDVDDEMHYANNFLTIEPRHIMAVGGQSEVYQRCLHDAGVRVEWIPLESLIDGYGAAHCMTQVLKRQTNSRR